MDSDNSPGKKAQTLFIELNTFLKIKGVCGTGGEAKNIIRSGKVKVDGNIETRNRRKLLLGMKVEYLGKVYVVEQSLLR